MSSLRQYLSVSTGFLEGKQQELSPLRGNTGGGKGETRGSRGREEQAQGGYDVRSVYDFDAYWS